MTLSAEQLDHYRSHGWLAPLRIMTESEAGELAAEFEAAEATHPRDLHAEHRNNAHLAFPFLADLARHPRIVDAVASIVGDHITLWSTVLFVKEPDSSAFVSWHQDALYMALAPADFVTAWVALTPSDAQTGCVAVIPGSHREVQPHRDTYGKDNILTRGQAIDLVDESAAVDLTLRPGEMSLHHPWLVHGSRPNRSGHRRIGVAMQSYLGETVRPTSGRHHVMHVRGRPVAAPFVAAPAPAAVCTDAARTVRAEANAALADVLYADASTRRAL